MHNGAEHAMLPPEFAGRRRSCRPCQSSSRPVSTIYKICEIEHWRTAVRGGVFRGKSSDARDGFIHLSSPGQVRDTAQRHFAGAANLMLLAVDAGALSGTLRWEPARGGELFPHLYGDLPLTAVIWVKPLSLGEDGRHVFPELEP
jgi:uncharacterized protein (DUF952 family)